MSSRKKQKRQQKVQERQRLKQAVAILQKGELPASGAEIGLSVDFEQEGQDQ
jgi:flagellar motor component MotA